MLVNPYVFAPSIPFSNVVFLSGFEGVDTSTSFVDESSYVRAVTAVGNAQIDTAQFKFGASSLLCDGSGDAATLADNADFEFGSGQFTLEGWFRPNSLASLAGDAGLITHGTADGGTLSYALRLTTTAPGAGIALQLSANGSAITTIAAAATISTSAFTHIAADRDGSGVVRVYLGGAKVASATFSSSLFNPAATVVMGIYPIGGTNRSYNGWMDEIRITKGFARYATDAGFTPPTSAFPRS